MRTLRESAANAICAAFFLCVVVLGSYPTRADVVGLWNFNDSNLIVDQGAGTLTAITALPITQVFAPGTTVNALGATVAGQGLALEMSAGLPDNGSFKLDFSVDMTGFQDLEVSWAWRGDPSWRSNPTLPGGIQVTYLFSINGGASFTALFQTIPPESFSLQTVLAASVASADNNPDFVFRIVQNPMGLTAGDQLVFDNIQFNGTAISPVPLPAALTLLLAALAGLGMFGWRRRRAAA